MNDFDKPAWAQDNFDMQLSIRPDTSKTFEAQTYHQVVIYNMGSCDVCKEMKSVTEAPSTATNKYRILQRGGLPIYVYCRIGGAVNDDANNCFP